MNQNVAITIIVLAMLYVGYNFTYNRDKFDSLNPQQNPKVSPTKNLFALDTKELKSKLEGLKDINIIKEKKAKLKVARAKEKLHDKMREFEDKLYSAGDNFQELETLHMQVSKLRRIAKEKRMYIENLDLKHIYYLLIQHSYTLSQINEMARSNPDALEVLEEDMYRESHRPYFVNQIREFKELPPISLREIASETGILLNDEQVEELAGEAPSNEDKDLSQDLAYPNGPAK